MLNAFDTNIQANDGALASKYNVSAEDIARVHQANLVWGWFDEALELARSWSTSLTADRDVLSAALDGSLDDLPSPPTLPDAPTVGPGPNPQPAKVEHGFFTFFSSLVAAIKRNTHYDVADGQLLGIEGTPKPKPTPDIVPKPALDIMTSGHPEVTCLKGAFQGYDVYLTRPGAARKFVGTSLARRYLVNEPLPAAGVAEIWIFEVQYRYQNAPFGQMSQAMSITVRG